MITRKIICIESGQIFQTIRSAARLLGVSAVRFTKVLNGYKSCKTIQGKHWKYYNDEDE